MAHRVEVLDQGEGMAKVLVELDGSPHGGRVVLTALPLRGRWAWSVWSVELSAPGAWPGGFQGLAREVILDAVLAASNTEEVREVIRAAGFSWHGDEKN